MKKHIIFALFCSLCALQITAAEPQYKFEVQSVGAANHHRVIAVNDSPATISTVVRIHGVNTQLDFRTPRTEVVPPHSTKDIGTIRAADSANGYEFNISFAFNAGDTSKKHDDTLYSLPFNDGVRARVSQAPGGTLSTHTDSFSRYAIDFAVPENTAIVAARGGVVIDTEASFKDGGLDKTLINKTNYIKIQHSDGTVASYLHLAYNGVSVRAGDRVKAAQLIGYSGSTGYSSGPHLHFGVNKVVITSDFRVINQSIPVAFYAYNPAVRISIKQGRTITVDYANPMPR